MKYKVDSEKVCNEAQKQLLFDLLCCIDGDFGTLIRVKDSEYLAVMSSEVAQCPICKKKALLLPSKYYGHKICCSCTETAVFHYIQTQGITMDNKQMQKGNRMNP